MEPLYGTLYETMGGAPVIRRLVEAFYPKVQANPLLGPLFPEDIMPVMEKQYQFLSQFFGGPTLYSDQYGHPMMRGRHMPFPITRERADAWLGCMSEAMDEIGLEHTLKHTLLERLRGPAYHFINQEAGE
jgi:hemoglobin